MAEQKAFDFQMRKIYSLIAKIEVRLASLERAVDILRENEKFKAKVVQSRSPYDLSARKNLE